MSEKEVFTQEESLKKTPSGIEYSEHKFVRNDGEEVNVRFIRSMKPSRLTEDNETFEEFKIRRAMVKKALKEKKGGRLLWNPYPFGKGTKGLSFNDKNVEVMDAVIKQSQKKQEETVDAGE